jgi:hypothetical protein
LPAVPVLSIAIGSAGVLTPRRDDRLTGDAMSEESRRRPARAPRAGGGTGHGRASGHAHERLAVSEDEIRERRQHATGGVTTRTAQLRANALRVGPAAGGRIGEHQGRVLAGGFGPHLDAALEGTHGAVALAA